MPASSTTAMIGQIQSCFLSNSPVREIVRPTDVLANVICAWAAARLEDELNRWRSQAGMMDFQETATICLSIVIAIRFDNHRLDVAIDSQQRVCRPRWHS